VSNYNYAEYVCEAVESAIEQEQSFDEIFVVDDGSKDDSVDRLKRRFSSNDNVIIIEKENGGQLSAFHRGVQESSGELCFFLDADDRYDSRLNRIANEFFAQFPTVDFLSVGFREFGETLSKPSRPKPTRDYGLTALSTIFDGRWIGNPTSCLSMRSGLVRCLLPYQDEEAWRIRADDVLVFGSSVLGAQKVHLNQPLVEYRLHHDNQFANRKQDSLAKMRHAIEVNRLIRYYVEKSGYEIELLGDLLPKEFRTHDRPTFNEFVRYARMCSRARLPWLLQAGFVTIMLNHYLSERRKKNESSDLQIFEKSMTETSTQDISQSEWNRANSRQARSKIRRAA